MKFRFSIAVAVGMALVLLGAPAASAASWYYMDVSANGDSLCMAAPTHNDIVLVTNYAGCEAVTFIDPTSYDGNTWWEIEASNGLCLNMVGGSGNDYVYADSCVSGDYNELWYNHVAGQLLNLEGNISNGEDTFLLLGTCDVTGPAESCTMAAWPDTFTGWSEVPA